MSEYERDQQIAGIVERAHTKFRESQRGYKGQMITARSSFEWWIANEALLSASAENKRLEALDKDWLRASEQWVAENADAQAKEAFALGKLEETLKIEGELRAENCAAKKMRNEIVGLCSLGEHHIREFAGNTNYNCLIDAVKEFDRVSTEQTRTQNG